MIKNLNDLCNSLARQPVYSQVKDLDKQTEDLSCLLRALFKQKELEANIVAVLDRGLEGLDNDSFRTILDSYSAKLDEKVRLLAEKDKLAAEKSTTEIDLF